MVVQAFFLGNVLPMMGVVGTLYQDSAVRVCNAYRLDDQQDLGRAMVLIAITTAALWLFRFAKRCTGNDATYPRDQAVVQVALREPGDT